MFLQQQDKVLKDPTILLKCKLEERDSGGRAEKGGQKTNKLNNEEGGFRSYLTLLKTESSRRKHKELSKSVVVCHLFIKS